MQGLDWCRTTAKSGRVYLHVFDWPAGGELVVPGVGGDVTRAYLLASPASSLALSEAGGSLTIQGPAVAPDDMDTIVVLDLAP